MVMVSSGPYHFTMITQQVVDKLQQYLKDNPEDNRAILIFQSTGIGDFHKAAGVTEFFKEFREQGGDSASHIQVLNYTPTVGVDVSDENF